MALQVWLPLRGDLNNYGLSDVTITNSGTTIDNNGKIGKCYKVTNSTKFTIATQLWMAINGSNSLSISMWIKYQGSSSYVIACNSYEIYFNSSTLGWRLGNGSGHTLNAYVTGTYTENTWYHLTCTWNCTNKILSTYINGSLMKSAIDTSTSAYNSILSVLSFSYSNTYYLNDLRIYDHCLSPKEVKEISLGLVLHYKLDDPYTENTTNLSTLGNCSGWNNSGTATRTSNDTSLPNIPEPSGKTVSILENTDGLCAITFGTTTVNVPSKTLTASVWIYISGDVTSSISPYIRSSKTDGNIGNLEYNNLSSIGSWPKNTWIRITKTFTTNSEATTVYFCAYIAKTGCKLTFNGWQIEEKDHVTPYVNGTRTENIIYDSSGYGNNGTITGTLNVNNNSPRYNKSILIGNNQIVSNNINIRAPYTISYWQKAESTENFTTNYYMIKWGNMFIYRDHNSTYQYSLLSAGTIINSNNRIGWNHIVVTDDGTTIKGYRNGVPIVTRSHTTNISTIEIGKGYSDFYASDVRIYATALSAEDILQLYQVNASIDNEGNIISNEFEEEYISKQQILKTGVVKIDNFLEINDKLKVLSDGSVFLLILHHNAPASNLFTSSNCWLNDGTNLYSALILLKDASWLLNLSEYEFLVCEKGTSSGTEHQCRWKQTSNPALSSTLSGYSVISGNSTRSWGLMNKNSYGCFHNGNTWWCCCGSYTYTGSTGGIPGFEDIVTTGYLDLYVKIPNEMIKGNIADFVKFYAKSILTNQLIEK